MTWRFMATTLTLTTSESLPIQTPDNKTNFF